MCGQVETKISEVKYNLEANFESDCFMNYCSPYHVDKFIRNVFYIHTYKIKERNAE